MKGNTSWIGMVVACCIGICSAAAAAPPTAPPASYQIVEKWTHKPPDGTTSIEQYV